MERKTHHPSGFGFCRLLVEFFTKQHQLHTADLKSHTIACVALWKISSISFFQFTASVCLSTLTSHARLSLNGLQAQFAELVRARGICAVMGRQTASKSSDSLSDWSCRSEFVSLLYVVQRLQYPLQFLFAPTLEPFQNNMKPQLVYTLHTPMLNYQAHVHCMSTTEITDVF